MSHTVLISERDLLQRIALMADEIIAAPEKPDMAAVILVGGFVFAADLLRALSRRGLDLPVEFFWLRSYAGMREGAREISVMIGPSTRVRDQHILVLDGILDRGRTLAKAGELLLEQGARKITNAVTVDRGRSDAGAIAQYAGFTGLDGFLIGYGMDDAAQYRGLPYIACID